MCLSKIKDRIKNDKDLKRVWDIFLVNKTLLIVVSIIAFLVLPFGLLYQINTENTFLNLWAQFDGEAYLTIAQHGYVLLPDGRELYNFLPLYPVLIKTFGFVGFDLAAFLLSNIFSFIAVFFMYKLVKLEFDDRIARRSIILLLFFPTAFFFTAIYTESLFLALVVSSLYYARKGNWILAGILSIFIPLTRVVGIFFFIPLGYEYLKQRDFKLSKINKDIGWAALSLLGIFVLFAVMFHLTGNPLGYVGSGAWERALSLPHVAIINAITGLSEGGAMLIYNLWNIFVLGLFGVLFIYSLFRIRFTYTLYMFFILLMPLLSSTLEAFSRFVLVAFPGFFIMALLMEKRRFKIPIMFMYVVFFVMLVFLTTRFVMGGYGNYLLEFL